MVQAIDDVTARGLAPFSDWSGMGESRHFVQFYEEDSFLLDSLGGFIAAGLREGDACLVLATGAHREGLEQRLQDYGLDVSAAVATGQYVTLDAAETLSEFMVEGQPDPELFAGLMTRLIARAAEGRRRVRVFGEMVALLWTEKRYDAALCLEQHWNNLHRSRSFLLFCAYPISGFSGEALASHLSGVCASHSRVIPAESYTGLADPDDRLRAIALLQQKARSLEALKDQLEVQVEDLRRLHEMSVKLTSTLDVEVVLEEVLQAAMAVHGTDLGLLSLCDAGQEAGLSVRVHRGFDEEFLKQIERVPAGAGSCGTSYEQRRRVVVEDVALDPIFAPYREAALRAGFRACHSTPLITRDGNIIGVLSVHFRRPHRPSERETRLMDLYAQTAADIIENARLHQRVEHELEERRQLLEREKAARAEAERHLQENIRLAAVYRDLARSLDPQEVTSTVCRAVRELTGADGATFVIQEGEEVLYADEEAVAPLWKGRQFPLTSCISGWSILERRPAVIEDIYADERIPVEAYRPTFVRSLAMVPVRALKPVGAIGAYWAVRHKASEDEVRVMQAVASAADLAFTNAQLYKQMQEARLEAEAANSLKNEFLATVSHELRTPLTAIVGWAAMLRGAKFDRATAERALETIERNAKAQTRLVEDLLDISRIITGKLRLDARSVDPGSVVQTAIETMRPAAEAKGVRIEKLFDSSVCVVSGDPARLQQVAWNLLANAIKFTPRGGRVEVRLERVDSHLEIVVSDTGEGIKPEFLPFVFDRFRQSDMSSTRRHGGLGLGLAIVRHLVELHGGTVRAESPGEGLGSTFTVSLPLVGNGERDENGRLAPSASKATAFPHVCPERLDGVRTLVVEDEPDMREILKLMLGRSGAIVTAVGTAYEALEAFGEAKPDVLVCDIGMPGEDGYELIRKVRALPKERGGRVPAIALTAYARTEDRLQALRAGYQMHVPKPVELAELVAVAASLVRRGE